MGISDEMLSAYLDRALSNEQTKAVENALQHDATLAARLDELRAVDSLLRNHAQLIDELPLPASVEQLLDKAAVQAQAQAQAEPDNVVSLADRRRRAWINPRFALPLAASVALVVGYAGGILSGSRQRSAEPVALLAAKIEPGSALHGLLESSESGISRRVADGQDAEVRLSFMARDNSLCRELTVGSASQTSHAVACRGKDNQWQVRLATLSREPAANKQGYQTASAGEDEAFGAAVDAMMAGDALTAEQERERSWVRRLFLGLADQKAIWKRATPRSVLRSAVSRLSDCSEWT